MVCIRGALGGALVDARARVISGSNFVSRRCELVAKRMEQLHRRRFIAKRGRIHLLRLLSGLPVTWRARHVIILGINSLAVVYPLHEEPAARFHRARPPRFGGFPVSHEHSC